MEAADLMEISQPTISRILTSGHMKIADAIVNGKALKIEGGDFKFIFRGFGCIGCKRESSSFSGDLAASGARGSGNYPRTTRMPPMSARIASHKTYTP